MAGFVPCTKITRGRKCISTISFERFLFKKTEFFDSTVHFTTNLSFLFHVRKWYDQGIAAKSWDIEKLNNEETEVKDLLYAIRESIRKKA